MDDGMTIDIGDAGHDAFLELVLRGYPDVAQPKRANLEKKPSMRLSHEPCRRFECSAMIRPLATSSAANKVVVPSACSRGSGPSRRARSGAQNTLVPAPMPEAQGFHRHREQSPWPAGHIETHNIGSFRRELGVIASSCLKIFIDPFSSESKKRRKLANSSSGCIVASPVQDRHQIAER